MANGDESFFALDVTISSEEARGFLSSLAYDEEAYKSFEENPREVLESLDGVRLKLPAGPLLPGDVSPPSMERLRKFVETGYPGEGTNPPPYNGGCLVWSILYGIASQTEAPEVSPGDS